MKTYNEVIKDLANKANEAYLGGSNNPYQYLCLETVAFIYGTTADKVFTDIQELCKF